MRHEILSSGKIALQKAGIESPALDARLLLQHILQITHEELIREPDEKISAHQQKNYFHLIERRAAGEPVSRIIGTREFWGLPFIVSPDVLDPRPDSETLIETALKHFPDRNAALNILDLGTGSGCLLIALLHDYPNARGIGVDQSEEALNIAQQNAQQNKVSNRAEWRKGNWWENWKFYPPSPMCHPGLVPGSVSPQAVSKKINHPTNGYTDPGTGAGMTARKFDLVISNPPYIPDSDRSLLAHEVINHDPHSALFGGTDGLDCYHAIFAKLKNHLAPNGKAFLEMGIHQAEPLSGLAAGHNLEVLEIVPDLGGIPRCLVLQ